MAFPLFTRRTQFFRSRFRTMRVFEMRTTPLRVVFLSGGTRGNSHYCCHGHKSSHCSGSILTDTGATRDGLPSNFVVRKSIHSAVSESFKVFSISSKTMLTRATAALYSRVLLLSFVCKPDIT